MKHPLLMLVIAAAVSACDPNAVAPPAPAPGGGAPVPATPPPATPTPLTPAGHGLPVKALPQDTFQYAASVTEVHDLTRQGDVTAKLFGMAGGDPTMNGLRTYLAFFRSPAEGWWVFGFGDFLSFKVLNETAGRLDLEVEESVMDPATGAITSQKRRMILAFNATDTVETSPPSVRLMPAT